MKLREHIRTAPYRVTADRAPIPAETPDVGLSVWILIDAASHGSPRLLALGGSSPTSSRPPGRLTLRRARPTTCFWGRFKISWVPQTPGRNTCWRQGDSFCFPPGHGYRPEDSSYAVHGPADEVTSDDMAIAVGAARV